MRRVASYLGFGILTAVLIIMAIVSYLTYEFRDTTPANETFQWAIENHIVINFILVIVAICFGFFWSYLTSHEIGKKEDMSKSVLDVVFLFLNTDEKKILDFLVVKKGETSQSEISRIEGMNRVKAFRSLQKMQEKGLVDVVSHGKVRFVKLRENILKVLVDGRS